MGSFCIFAGARRAGADVVVESQNRSIEAAVREWHHDYTLDEDVEVFSQQDTAQAPNAGPFDRDLTVQYVQSYGHASQTSTIAPDRFQGSGSIGVYSETDVGGSYGSGDSAYRVTFRAEAPQRYVLAWDRVADPAVRSDGEHRILQISRLDEDGGSTTVVRVPGEVRSPFAGNPPLPQPLTGILSEGRYEFLFDDGQTSDGGSDWKYSFQLDLTTVPEPAVFASLPALLLPLLHRRRHPVC